MPTYSEDARAKVNLTLRVFGRRADGYHDIESVVAFGDCADHLTLTEASELDLVASGPLAEACGATSDNLIIKSARLLSERVPGLKVGRFTLDKRLPVAAGIGGGSADAAAALRLLARLNNLAPDDPRIMEVARLTGADVPVCVPSCACVMTGVGETLQPLHLPTMPAVMVNPGVPVATRDVFNALGLRNGELRVGASDVLLQDRAWPAADAPIGEWIAAFVDVENDLEIPALKTEPVIGEVLAALRDSEGVKLTRMSGSGATCFAIYQHAADAQAAATKLRQAYPGWWVHAGTLG